MASGTNRVVNGVTGTKYGRIHARILIDERRRRMARLVRPCDETQAAALLSGWIPELLIRRFQVFDRRNDPDLQEVRGRRRRRVELAVDHAGARAHRLHFVRAEHVLLAHAVLVRKPALEHVGEDLHVAMAVRAEAFAGSHTIVVEHTQRTKPHVLRVVIPAERKRVIAVQPPQIGVAAVLGLAQRQHALILTLLSRFAR